jgi:hypothetical protein
MTELARIDFHGDALWAAVMDDGVYVAAKSIATNLTLSWHGQRERMLRDPVLANAIRLIRIPSPGGEQETLCLRLELLPGWLFGVDMNRIKSHETREKLVRYKEECFAVLYRHFFPPRPVADGAPVPDSSVPQQPEPLTLQEARLKLEHVREARVTHGLAAARALWKSLDLPWVEAMAGSALPTVALGPIERWWLSRLRAGAPASEFSSWVSVVPRHILLNDCRRSLGMAGPRRSAETEIGMALRRIIPNLGSRRAAQGVNQGGNQAVNQARIWCYVLPPLEECRAFFEALVGQKISGSDDDGGGG